MWRKKKLSDCEICKHASVATQKSLNVCRCFSVTDEGRLMYLSFDCDFENYNLCHWCHKTITQHFYKKDDNICRDQAFIDVHFIPIFKKIFLNSEGRLEAFVPDKSNTNECNREDFIAFRQDIINNVKIIDIYRKRVYMLRLLYTEKSSYFSCIPLDCVNCIINYL